MDRAVATVVTLVLASLGLAGRGSDPPDRTVAGFVAAVRLSPAEELAAALPRGDYWAETRANLRWVEVGRERWLNYSFRNTDRRALDPDWPISLIFYGRADVERVKALFGGGRIATRKYAVFDDGTGPYWNADRGVKMRVRFEGPDGPDGDSLHVRVFAPPRGYFEGPEPWGRYVIATVHLDFNPPFDNVCGCSEDAERLALEMAERRGYRVVPHGLDLANAETFRVRKGHYRQSDGYAGLVHIPESPAPAGGKAVSHAQLP